MISIKILITFMLGGLAGALIMEMIKRKHIDFNLVSAIANILLLTVYIWLM